MIYNWSEGWIETPLGRYQLGPCVGEPPKLYASGERLGQEYRYICYYNDETGELRRYKHNDAGVVYLDDDGDIATVTEFKKIGLADFV